MMKIKVHNGLFNVVKAQQPQTDAFAYVNDNKEITLIIESQKMKNSKYKEIESGWKIITFDQVLPFNLVGFLAKVTRALAEANIPIFVISSYSTDHILVKERDLDKAVKVIGELNL